MQPLGSTYGQALVATLKRPPIRHRIDPSRLGLGTRRTGVVPIWRAMHPDLVLTYTAYLHPGDAHVHRQGPKPGTETLQTSSGGTLTRVGAALPSLDG